MDYYQKCQLCPRKCLVNRHREKGFCNSSNKIKVALAKPFFYEEPPISGTNGSGAIFFSGCNLKCCFCQNMEISRFNKGAYISITRLSEIMLELQEKKVHNINLVTPTMFIPSIAKAIKKAKKNGLKIPIVYNSSGYENTDSLKLLDGLIDIYLPDFKYFDNKYAIKYSKAPNYKEKVMSAIHEMVRQVGKCQFDNSGLLIKGVIVRHLMLPGLTNDTKNILSYLYNTYHDTIYLSIMNQYTPFKYIEFSELKKTLKKEEYDKIICYATNLGITNAFCQLDGTIEESFIPFFNLEGVKKNN